MDTNTKRRIYDAKGKDQHRRKLLDGRKETKRKRLPSIETNEKEHLKRNTKKVKGLYNELVNEEMKNVKLSRKKRTKKGKETLSEIADEDKPGCSHHLDVWHPWEKRTEYSIVILDLETTGLIRGGIIPHITQIAAMECSTKKRFSKYICPRRPISTDAEMITGLSWNSETLIYRGQPVECVDIKTALQDFMTWLQKFPDVTIVAHNGRRFDFRVLSTAVHNCGLSDMFHSSLTRFCDSLEIFRHKHPELKKHSQAYLAQHFCAGACNAHNAVNDVKTLYKILQAASVTFSDFMEHSDTVECWVNEAM